MIFHTQLEDLRKHPIYRLYQLQKRTALCRKKFLLLILFHKLFQLSLCSQSECALESRGLDKLIDGNIRFKSQTLVFLSSGGLSPSGRKGVCFRRLRNARNEEVWEKTQREYYL